MRIRQLCEKSQYEKKKLFIPYITGGDPTLHVTGQIIKELVSVGADIIELGVPFSDPLADGKTNQLSAMRALKNQVTLTDCCHLVHCLRQQNCHIPIILFTYFNPIIRLGISKFVQLVSDTGVDAVLVVDLPFEETTELAAELAKKNIGMIFLISPTTCAERIKKCSEAGPEFLYYISRTGVTGAQSELSATLEKEVLFVRKHSNLPIAVGFGISTPEQAAAVAKIADAVIVGSALVKMLEHQEITQLIDMAAELSAAIK